MNSDDFDEIFAKAVEEALSEYGDAVHRVIEYYLRTRHHLTLDEVPRRIREFSSALRLMFGSGARVIEAKIASKLCEKLGIFFEPSLDINFEEFIESLRKAYTQSKGDSCASVRNSEEVWRGA